MQAKTEQMVRDAMLRGHVRIAEYFTGTRTRASVKERAYDTNVREFVHEAVALGLLMPADSANTYVPTPEVETRLAEQIRLRKERAALARAKHAAQFKARLDEVAAERARARQARA